MWNETLDVVVVREALGLPTSRLVIVSPAVGHHIRQTKPQKGLLVVFEDVVAFDPEMTEEEMQTVSASTSSTIDSLSRTKIVQDARIKSKFLHCWTCSGRTLSVRSSPDGTLLLEDNQPTFNFVSIEQLQATVNAIRLVASNPPDPDYAFTPENIGKVIFPEDSQRLKMLTKRHGVIDRNEFSVASLFGALITNRRIFVGINAYILAELPFVSVEKNGTIIVSLDNIQKLELKTSAFRQGILLRMWLESVMSHSESRSKKKHASIGSLPRMHALLALHRQFCAVSHGEGNISREQLHQLMQPLYPASKISDSMFRFFDTDNSGEISFEEFASGMLGLLSPAGTSLYDRYRFTFSLFDENGDGSLSEREVRMAIELMQRTGLCGSSPVSTQEFGEVVHEIFVRLLTVSVQKKNTASTSSSSKKNVKFAVLDSDDNNDNTINNSSMALKDEITVDDFMFGLDRDDIVKLLSQLGIDAKSLVRFPAARLSAELLTPLESDWSRIAAMMHAVQSLIVFYRSNPKLTSDPSVKEHFVGTDFMIPRVLLNLPNATEIAKSFDVGLTVYEPCASRRMQQLILGELQEFERSFAVDDISGSLMLGSSSVPKRVIDPQHRDSIRYDSQDGKYTIKSIREMEMKALRAKFSELVDHVEEYPNSYVPRYVALFTINAPTTSTTSTSTSTSRKQQCIEPLHFFVRQNPQPSCKILPGSSEFNIDMKGPPLGQPMMLDPGWQEAILGQLEADIDKLSECFPHGRVAFRTVVFGTASSGPSVASASAAAAANNSNSNNANDGSGDDEDNDHNNAFGGITASAAATGAGTDGSLGMVGEDVSLGIARPGPLESKISVAAFNKTYVRDYVPATVEVVETATCCSWFSHSDAAKGRKKKKDTIIAVGSLATKLRQTQKMLLPKKRSLADIRANNFPICFDLIFTSIDEAILDLEERERISKSGPRSYLEVERPQVGPTAQERQCLPYQRRSFFDAVKRSLATRRVLHLPNVQLVQQCIADTVVTVNGTEGDLTIDRASKLLYLAWNGRTLFYASLSKSPVVVAPQAAGSATGSNAVASAVAAAAAASASVAVVGNAQKTKEQIETSAATGFNFFRRKHPITYAGRRELLLRTDLDIQTGQFRCETTVKFTSTAALQRFCEEIIRSCDDVKSFQPLTADRYGAIDTSASASATTTTTTKTNKQQQHTVPQSNSMKSLNSSAQNIANNNNQKSNVKSSIENITQLLGGGGPGQLRVCSIVWNVSRRAPPENMTNLFDTMGQHADLVLVYATECYYFPQMQATEITCEDDWIQLLEISLTGFKTITTASAANGRLFVAAAYHCFHRINDVETSISCVPGSSGLSQATCISVSMQVDQSSVAAVCVDLPRHVKDEDTRWKILQALFQSLPLPSREATGTSAASWTTPVEWGERASLDFLERHNHVLLLGDFRCPVEMSRLEIISNLTAGNLDAVVGRDVLRKELFRREDSVLASFDEAELDFAPSGPFLYGSVCHGRRIYDEDDVVEPRWTNRVLWKANAQFDTVRPLYYGQVDAEILTSRFNPVISMLDLKTRIQYIDPMRRSVQMQSRLVTKLIMTNISLAAPVMALENPFVPHTNDLIPPRFNGALVFGNPFFGSEPCATSVVEESDTPRWLDELEVFVEGVELNLFATTSLTASLSHVDSANDYHRICCGSYDLETLVQSSTKLLRRQTMILSAAGIRLGLLVFDVQLLMA